MCKNTFAGAHNYCHLCSAPRTSGDIHPWLRVTSYLCKTCRDACAETRVSPLADSNVGVGSKLVTHLRKRRWSSEAQPFKWRVYRFKLEQTILHKLCRKLNCEFTVHRSSVFKTKMDKKKKTLLC